VVSGDTRTAIGTGAPTGVRFRDLGRHRLPGLLEAEALFQVLARGLRGEFPPPRSQRGAAARRSAVARTRRDAQTPARQSAGQLELPQSPS